MTAYFPPIDLVPTFHLAIVLLLLREDGLETRTEKRPI